MERNTIDITAGGLIDESTAKTILDEAIRLGDEMLSKAEKHEDGLYWKTIAFVDAKEYRWNVAYGLYSGIAGICFFYIQLYKLTGDVKYLDTSKEGLRYTEKHCIEGLQGQYSLVSGRAGVSYTFLELWKVTADDTYLQKALDLMRSCDEFFDAPYIIDDMLNGFCGALIGLIHLHAASKEEWLLPHINKYIQLLIRRTHHGQKGLYWDKSARQIKGLCGFSHGAAGLAFSFLELGRYFKNPAFYWLAEQACLYEDNVFSKESGWPDFRLGVFTPKDRKEHEEAFRSGDKAFFTEPKYMNAWCHGAPGIGLTRLRMYEVLGDDYYKDSIEHALRITARGTDAQVEHGMGNVSLCHGLIGDSDLYINAYNALGDEQYLQKAKEVSLTAIKHKQAGGFYKCGNNSFAGEDLSLFLGNSGLGYFLLRTLAPKEVSGITAIAMNNKLTYDGDVSAYPAISQSTAQMKKSVVENVYPRTMQLLDHMGYGEAIIRLFAKSGMRDDDKAFFVEYVRELIKELEGKKADSLQEILELEQLHFNTDIKLGSNAQYQMEETLLNENFQQYFEQDESEFLQLTLQNHPKLQFIETGWDWTDYGILTDVNEDNFGEETHTICLKSYSMITMEKKVSALSEVLLELFEKPMKVGDVVHELYEYFEAEAEEEKEQVKQVAIQQIKELMASKIFIDNEGYELSVKNFG